MQHSVTIGPWQVLLLPKSVVVGEQELLKGVGPTTLDLVHAGTSADRRNELLRSRWFLRTRCGLDEDPGRTTNGELIWPQKKAGSISHKKGHIAGAVIATDQWRTLGIDLETYEVSEKIRSRVLTDTEFGCLSLVGTDRQRIAAAFVVKEAVFKAVFPLGRQMFWFEDAKIADVQPRVESRGSREITYVVHTEIGPRAGGPIEWNRKCEVYLRAIDIDGDSYWVAACGMTTQSCGTASTLYGVAPTSS